MYYTIYKITNLINNKIYIGQHITKNINDNYFGSGKNIKSAIKKYGKEKFKKEILFVYDNFDDMNNKEREIVNEEFICRNDTYNICLGGGQCLCDKIIKVKNKTTNLYEEITLSKYQENKNLYEHINKHKMTVYDITKNINVFIHTSDFNPEIHRYYVGGIVVEKNGIPQNMSKEEFLSGNYSGIHKGKITAKILETGEIKHISVEEYNLNKSLYESINKNKLTVYDINQNKFISIRANEFDLNIHKLAKWKYLICFNSKGEILFEFFGSQKEFLEKYNVPLGIWNRYVVTGRQIKRQDTKLEIGCYFKSINWKEKFNIKNN